MKVNDILAEAQGLRAAQPGEIYASPDGTIYTFVKWHSDFPEGQTGYETPALMNAEISKLLTPSPKQKVIWLNRAGTANKSFAYSEFSSEPDLKLLVAKFFRQNKSSNTITDTELRLAANLDKQRAGKKSNFAIKAEAKVKPAELGLADNTNKTAKQIAATVGSHSQGPMLTNSVLAAASGKPIVFTGGAKYLQALQDDFCEVITPVAIMSNHPSVTGQIKEAILDVFKGENLTGATARFPAGMNNPLVDSYVISKSGLALGVSNKGGKGAQATATVIYKIKEEALANQGPALIQKFSEASKILDLIQDTPSSTGPIVIAREYGLVNPSILAALEPLVTSSAVRMSPQYRLTGDPTVDLAKVPKKLLPLFKSVKYRPGSYMPLICLAQVARIVANFINTDPTVNFGEAVRSFLNHSNMVQATVSLSAKGEDAVLNSISVSYPPNFKNKARIESNSYCGTTIVTKLKIELPKS